MCTLQIASFLQKKSSWVNGSPPVTVPRKLLLKVLTDNVLPCTELRIAMCKLYLMILHYLSSPHYILISALWYNTETQGMGNNLIKNNMRIECL